MTDTAANVIGPIVVELRADAAVVAKAGSVNKIAGREARVETPCVIVERLDTSFTPWGAGSARAGVARNPLAIKCAWPKVADGDIHAYDLGGRVLSCLLRLGPHTGTRGVRIHQIVDAAIGPVLLDPDSKEPYVIVSATVLAGALAST